MKVFCFLLFIIASCRVTNTNGFAPADDKKANHLIEITFVNSGANYSTIINAIQKNGIGIEAQYIPVVFNYRPVTTLSFHCNNISDAAVEKIKAAIGSCDGIISLNDTVVN